MSNETKHIDNVLSWISGNAVPGESTPSKEILQSWTRSVNDHKLDPASSKRPLILSKLELKDYQEPLDKFLWLAKAGLSNLYNQLSVLDYVVVLADSSGVNVDFKANKCHSRELKQEGVYLGSVWSEENEGTNGVGVCIKTQTPNIIHTSDHFRARHMNLTCSAAPIFDPYGKLLAVLDASGIAPRNPKESQFLILQLVKQTAKLIEQAHFLEEFKNYYVLKIFEQKEFAQVSQESFLAFDEEGTILAANKEAGLLLAKNAGEMLIGRNLENFLKISLDDLLFHTREQQTIIWPMTLSRDNIQAYASLSYPEKPIISVSKIENPAENATNKPSGTNITLTLEDLAGADPLLVNNVHCVRRVLNKDISILLLGETGTGKEAFAQAIHNASNRSNKNFVALNCAAIPESLIESELFGYEEGAFTGAKKKGMQGKISESQGGTLFLDEIGDMPTQLQTRLLRVLAEKEVVPLGGGSAIKIDLHVICATHRDLKQRISDGSFREDLYYRLNGISLVIPSIHERADKISLIYSAFKAEAGNVYAKISIGEDALDVLSSYDWPGNIRQLRNVLRYALAINESGTIGINDLPPDICKECKERIISKPIPVNGLTHKMQAEAKEKDEIVKILKDTNSNITLSAKKLGIGRATIYRKMEKYGINP